MTIIHCHFVDLVLITLDIDINTWTTFRSHILNFPTPFLFHEHWFLCFFVLFFPQMTITNGHFIHLYVLITLSISTSINLTDHILIIYSASFHVKFLKHWSMQLWGTAGESITIQQSFTFSLTITSISEIGCPALNKNDPKCLFIQ